MTDHGHDLLFGAFVTPDARRHEHVLALALAAEDLGLDVLTFQDHPYQPSFLDTWTLLSFLAARTRRISLATNVANVPLRPPAVLARSAAALDILSGGRLELGLGAGYFLDASTSMRWTRPSRSSAACGRLGPRSTSRPLPPPGRCPPRAGPGASDLDLGGARTSGGCWS